MLPAGGRRHPDPPTAVDPVDLALTGMRRVAVVGLSPDPGRESHGVAAALQRAGWTIVPVNPNAEEVLGEQSYPDLASVPGRVDVVDVFRREEHLPGVAEEAVARDDVAVVWNQLGLRSAAAAATVRGAGRCYVEDRCLKVEVARRRAVPPAGPRLETGVVLLDLDDTIVDHDASEEQAAAATLRAAGLPDHADAVATYVAINAEEWAAYRAGRTDPAALRVARWRRTVAALGDHAGDVDVEAVARDYLDRFGATAVPLPGAVAAVWWLARRSRVAIATNGFADTQASRLDAVGVAPLVEVMASSETAGAAKPDPAVLRLALDRLGVVEGEGASIAMIGDQLETDVAAGTAIGATTVWVAPDDAVVPAGASAPDVRVRRLADIA